MSHFSDTQNLRQEMRQDAIRESRKHNGGSRSYPFMFGWMVSEAAEFAMMNRQSLDTIQRLKSEIRQLRQEIDSIIAG